jgi:hypothetical protein
MSFSVLHLEFSRFQGTNLMVRTLVSGKLRHAISNRTSAVNGAIPDLFGNHLL